MRFWIFFVREMFGLDIFRGTQQMDVIQGKNDPSPPIPSQRTIKEKPDVSQLLTTFCSFDIFLSLGLLGLL